MIFAEIQVHEMAMLSAVQEAQKDNLRSFNDYMMSVLQVSLSALTLYLSILDELLLLNNQKTICHAKLVFSGGLAKGKKRFPSEPESNFNTT